MKHLIAFLLLASTAHAGSIVELRQTAPDENRKMMTYRWSGTVVFKKDVQLGQILTCAHKYNRKYPVEVLIHRNQWVVGRIVAIDTEADLCLVEAQTGPTIPAVPLALTSPDVGETVTIGGYGHQVYAEKRTKITAVTDDGYLRIDAATRPGDSGGALLCKGKLVGVHVRGDGKDGWEVPVEDVHEFLIEKAGWVRR